MRKVTVFLIDKNELRLLLLRELHSKAWKNA